MRPFLWPLLLAVIAFFCLEASGLCADAYSAMGVVQAKRLSRAPQFRLSGIDGKERGPADFKGKVVLLNFWATWCEPCRDEMPALEKLWKELGPKGLVIIGVAGDKGNMHKVGEFCRMHEVSFPVLFDTSGEVAASYQANIFPTSFIIGKDGTIKGKIMGPRQWDGAASVMFFDELLKN